MISIQKAMKVRATMKKNLEELKERSIPYSIPLTEEEYTGKIDASKKPQAALDGLSYADDVRFRLELINEIGIISEAIEKANQQIHLLLIRENTAASKIAYYQSLIDSARPFTEKSEKQERDYSDDTAIKIKTITQYYGRGISADECYQGLIEAKKDRMAIQDLIAALDAKPTVKYEPQDKYLIIQRSNKVGY